VGACDGGGRTPAQLVTVPERTDPQYEYATKLQRLLSTTAAAKSKVPSRAQGAAGEAAGTARMDGTGQRAQQQQAVAASQEKRLRQVGGITGGSSVASTTCVVCACGKHCASSSTDVLEAMLGTE
jgi:hypothetical protein